MRSDFTRQCESRTSAVLALTHWCVQLGSPPNDVIREVPLISFIARSSEGQRLDNLFKA